MYTAIPQRQGRIAFLGLLIQCVHPLDVEPLPAAANKRPTIFHQAARCGQLQTIQDAIHSLQNKNPACIKEILNQKDGSAKTALYYAITKGHLDICKLFVQNGADLKCLLPIIEIIKKYKILLSLIAYITEPTEIQAVFQWAICRDRTDLYKPLLTAWKKITNNTSLLIQPNQQGKPPLHLAAERGHINSCRSLFHLLQNNNHNVVGCIKQLDHTERNVLHGAAEGGYKQTCKRILKELEDRQVYEEIIDLISQPDQEGEDALLVAIKNGYKKIYWLLIELLEQYGGNSISASTIRRLNNKRQNALHLAIENSYSNTSLKLFNQLLAYNSDIAVAMMMQRDNQNKTILHIAVEKGYDHICLPLLLKPCDDLAADLIRQSNDLQLLQEFVQHYDEIAVLIRQPEDNARLREELLKGYRRDDRAAEAWIQKEDNLRLVQERLQHYDKIVQRYDNSVVFIRQSGNLWLLRELLQSKNPVAKVKQLNGPLFKKFQRRCQKTAALIEQENQQGQTALDLATQNESAYLAELLNYALESCNIQLPQKK